MAEEKQKLFSGTHFNYNIIHSVTSVPFKIIKNVNTYTMLDDNECVWMWVHLTSLWEHVWQNSLEYAAPSIQLTRYANSTESAKLNMQCNLLDCTPLCFTPPTFCFKICTKLQTGICVPLRSYQKPSSSPFPLPYIIAENNSTPKQTGKCLMILYPSMSSWCQWNIVPWARISFPSRRGATAGSRERRPGTKFKHHFTPSNKGANGRDGRGESVTWNDFRRWMSGSPLAIWWRLAPYNSSSGTATRQFFVEYLERSLLCNSTTNIHDTFYRVSTFLLEDCFLWF